MAARILIVDDHVAARTNIRSLLDWHSFEVCGDAKNGKEAVEKVIELEPDVVLLGLNMPVMNGIQTAYEIRRIAPSTKIVFLTNHDSPQLVCAMRVLSDDFVSKSAAGTELILTLNRLEGFSLSADQIGPEAMMGTLRLLVADDHDLVRRGLRALLEEQPGWEVVAEAVDGREAVEKAKLVQPDVTILDLSMPELNGLEATREILRSISTKVLILTMDDSDPLIRQMLEAGVQGYLLKSDAGRDLVAAVDALRRNETFFTPKVAQMVLEGYQGRPSNGNGDDSNRKNRLRLTTRQNQILQLLAEGKSSKAVAVALNISIKTAETHRANIMRRLDCHSVTTLVRYAIRNHIIEA